MTNDESLQPICACFGHPVGGNPSQYMMERTFAHHDLDWRYLTLDVRPDELPAAIAGMRAMGFSGVNLATPHKLEVVPHLDELSESAKLSQSVNCVRRDNGKLIGENTDGQGFVRAVSGQLDPQGLSVVLFGAGGAARSIAVELAQAGCASITVVNRSRERGEALVELLNANFTPPAIDDATGGANDDISAKEDTEQSGTEEAKSEQAPVESLPSAAEDTTATNSQQNEPSAEATSAEAGQPPEAEPRQLADFFEWTVEYDIPVGTQLVINATSIGQFDGRTRLDVAVDTLEGVTLVADIALNPVKTRFVHEALEHGCQVLDSVGMLVQQAAICFELWTGVKPDLETMQDALEEFFGV